MKRKSIYDADEWIGKKYNALTVVEPVHVVLNNGDSQWFWKVKCDCGNEKIMKPIEVINGKMKSCGCGLNRKTTATHRESHTKLHNIWCGMNNRCNPNNKYTERYGKRGICICDQWKDYTVFAEWARSNGYEDGLTIERIDVNGNYCPENCTWIPMKKQARNRRTTHWVEYHGVRMSLAEACEKAGLPYKQVFERIVKRNWPVDEALSIPIGGAKKKRSGNTRSELARQAGLKPSTVNSRLKYGWTEEEALGIPTVGKGANQTTYKKNDI